MRGHVTVKGLVESKQQFRRTGADEEQLERFERLSDLAKLMCVGIIRRGPATSVEEALHTAELSDERLGKNLLK